MSRLCRVLLALAEIIVFASVTCAEAAGPESTLSVAGVTIIRPKDAAFSHVLAEKFPGFTSLAGFQAMEPFLVLLSNADIQPVPSYAVRWTITDPGARITHIDQIVLRRDHKPLAASGVRLVSPLFVLTPREYASLTAHSKWPYSAAQYPLAASNRSIAVALDGVVTEDDVELGLGSTNLFVHHACSSKAEADEAKYVESRLAAGESATELRQSLLRQALSGIASGDKSDPQSVYLFERARHAERVANLIRNAGIEGLQGTLTEMKVGIRHGAGRCGAVNPDVIVAH